MPRQQVLQRRQRSSIAKFHLSSILKLLAYESNELFPHPERDTQNVFDYYLMDAASVLVTEALDLEMGDKVLDLCAAPGGKTLGILQQLDLLQASLVANEPSPTRSKRLSKVISEYVPENLRTSIRVTRRNGIKWTEYDLYDKVLVDSPCSSERHLLHDPKELGTWTPRRTENCAKRQLALLFAALRAAKLYGRIVYSTCSLSQLENDSVISNVGALRPLFILYFFLPLSCGSSFNLWSDRQ
ncbi:5-methylcytosine rRNA methyltransferase NSUN4 [Selaginella moellendorffii]|uniref:5-methylcytosine rRNA methyltransferase NSUN4 n=1 Tax=Selaginella moellendorffii TaxID=88036 RepID=UPI000D1C3534|nr:5-methylcytosine rRNA methyltransferase NSUN4 [Selaginella moellendorffii]|eukprot:XP_024516256.1 5-methylcytosine rRNA methyltransferase NSUN4 [Selaginella moellendorffii]